MVAAREAARTEATPSEPSERSYGLERLREEENAVLIGAGFKGEETGLWVRENVFYGRNAALQNVRRG